MKRTALAFLVGLSLLLFTAGAIDAQDNIEQIKEDNSAMETLVEQQVQNNWTESINEILEQISEEQKTFFEDFGNNTIEENETNVSDVIEENNTINETENPEQNISEPDIDGNDTNITSHSSCEQIADGLGGVAVTSGDICDVILVRQNPTISGMDGRNLNRFTLMNSVLEFERQSYSTFYVMGDFALLESEMNPVLSEVKANGWTVTGIHNHMIGESPKTTFVHFESTGSLDELIIQANNAVSLTSIRG